MKMNMHEAFYCLSHGDCSMCKFNFNEQTEDCAEMASQIGAAAIQELIKQGKQVKYKEEDEDV